MPLYDVKVPVVGYVIYKDVEADNEEEAIKMCLENGEPELVTNEDDEGFVLHIDDTDLAETRYGEGGTIENKGLVTNPEAHESYPDGADLSSPLSQASEDP